MLHCAGLSCRRPQPCACSTRQIGHAALVHITVILTERLFRQLQLVVQILPAASHTGERALQDRSRIVPRQHTHVHMAEHEVIATAEDQPGSCLPRTMAL